MNNQRTTKAFTIVELLALIVMIALLGATLLPAMASVKIRTQLGGCLNNQKQLAMAWQSYANDNNGSFVSPGDGGTNAWCIRPNNIGWIADPNRSASTAAEACKG